MRCAEWKNETYIGHMLFVFMLLYLILSSYIWNHVSIYTYYTCMLSQSASPLVNGSFVVHVCMYYSWCITSHWLRINMYIYGVWHMHVYAHRLLWPIGHVAPSHAYLHLSYIKIYVCILLLSVFLLLLFFFLQKSSRSGKVWHEMWIIKCSAVEIVEEKE